MNIHRIQRRIGGYVPFDTAEAVDACFHMAKRLTIGTNINIVHRRGSVCLPWNFDISLRVE